jgi:hypothetical protein
MGRFVLVPPSIKAERLRGFVVERIQMEDDDSDTDHSGHVVNRNNLGCTSELFNDQSGYTGVSR